MGVVGVVGEVVDVDVGEGNNEGRNEEVVVDGNQKEAVVGNQKEAVVVDGNQREAVVVGDNQREVEIVADRLYDILKSSLCHKTELVQLEVDPFPKHLKLLHNKDLLEEEGVDNDRSQNEGRIEEGEVGGMNPLTLKI